MIQAITGRGGKEGEELMRERRGLKVDSGRADGREKQPAAGAKKRTGQREKGKRNGRRRSDRERSKKRKKSKKKVTKKLGKKKAKKSKKKGARKSKKKKNQGKEVGRKSKQMVNMSYFSAFY